jgi:hypothetical protein
MFKIGVLYGMENTFPPALIECINGKKIPDVSAESIRIGATSMAEASGYRVIVDRISHEVDFYRTYLKNAALNGTIIINNPFWWSADDRFFNCGLAKKLGIAVPETIVLPQKSHPPGVTSQSLRNLLFPIDWDEVFATIGFPAYLKPFDGNSWKHAYHVHSPEQFFAAYDQTDSTCMILQAAVKFEAYYRCYVVGQKHVRVMAYDPTLPYHLRYKGDQQPIGDELVQLLTDQSLTICRALGYDFNTVEFAMEKGVPYATDFFNPAPDADIHSVGPENFNWVVNKSAELAIEKALSKEGESVDLRWNNFICGHAAKASTA